MSTLYYYYTLYTPVITFKDGNQQQRDEITKSILSFNRTRPYVRRKYKREANSTSSTKQLDATKGCPESTYPVHSTIIVARRSSRVTTTGPRPSQWTRVAQVWCYPCIGSRIQYTLAPWLYDLPRTETRTQTGHRTRRRAAESSGLLRSASTRTVKTKSHILLL
jgi:hypothetical protein